MAPRYETPVILLAGGGIALVLSGLAALSALGPLLFGLYLIVCELSARPFARVQRLQDLAAPETRIGAALTQVELAEARALREGERQALPHRSDGFYFDERDVRGEPLNLRLAYLFVARQQLAHEFDHAAARWSAAISRRNAARIGALLFVAAILLLGLCEPPGAAKLLYGDPRLGVVRLLLSAAAAVAALCAMSLVGRSAAHALVEGMSALEPLSGLRGSTVETAAA